MGLVGCGSTLKKDLSVLNSTKACCDSLSKITYQPITDQKLTIELGKGKKVRLFNDIKSYFAALEIVNEPTSLEIQSYITGGWLPSAHIVVPKLILLDEKYKIVRELDWTYTWGSDPWIGSYMTAQLTLMPDEKYLIVYAENSKPNKRIEFVNYNSGLSPVYTGSGTIYIPTSDSKTFQLPLGPTGRIDILVKDNEG